MLQEHLGYVSDSERLSAYARAIADIIKPGDSVTDLGCGSGVLGLLCLRAGAARVYAIDATAMIGVARVSYSRASLGDRAIFIRGESRQVDLPERVDVVVCDQVGYFGFDAGIVQDYADALRRFLKPGGSLIPGRIGLHVAAVDSKRAYAAVDAWESDSVPPEFRWLREYAVNSRHPIHVDQSELLTTAAQLGTIDLREENRGLLSWTTRLRMSRDGAMHGVVGWFDCELSAGVWMTNSPLAQGPIKRAQAFLPIREAVAVRADEEILVTVMARPSEDLIAWVVELPSGQRFRHSTWQGAPLTPEDVIRSNRSHVPRLNRAGAARSTILAYCDGHRTVEEIEEAVTHDHPALFPSSTELSRFVAHVLSKDTE